MFTFEQTIRKVSETFIKDYRKIKPTKIFALDVFEHVPKEEIEKILNNFQKLNEPYLRYECLLKILILKKQH